MTARRYYSAEMRRFYENWARKALMNPKGIKSIYNTKAEALRLRAEIYALRRQLLDQIRGDLSPLSEIELRLREEPNGKWSLLMTRPMDFTKVTWFNEFDEPVDVGQPKFDLEEPPVPDDMIDWIQAYYERDGMPESVAIVKAAQDFLDRKYVKKPNWDYKKKLRELEAAQTQNKGITLDQSDFVSESEESLIHDPKKDYDLVRITDADREEAANKPALKAYTESERKQLEKSNKPHA